MRIKTLVTVLLVALVLLLIVTVFLLLFWAFNGPSVEIVGPAVAIGGLVGSTLVCIVLGAALEDNAHQHEIEENLIKLNAPFVRKQAEAKLKYKATKNRVESGSCPLSERTLCFMEASKLPEGLGKGTLQSSCTKKSAETSCTTEVLEACKEMMETADKDIRIQFKDFASKASIPDLLTLCATYASS